MNVQGGRGGRVGKSLPRVREVRGSNSAFLLRIVNCEKDEKRRKIDRSLLVRMDGWMRAHVKTRVAEMRDQLRGSDDVIGTGQHSLNKE